jgi:hypothetical protein
VKGQSKGTRNYKNAVFMGGYEGVVVHYPHFT